MVVDKYELMMMYVRGLAAAAEQDESERGEGMFTAAQLIMDHDKFLTDLVENKER